MHQGCLPMMPQIKVLACDVIGESRYERTGKYARLNVTHGIEDA